MALTDPITLHRLRVVCAGLLTTARRLKLIAGSGVTLTPVEVESELQVTIAATGGGGGGAPTDAQYVTLATDTNLTDERVLVVSTGLTMDDGGAGQPVTLSATSGMPPWAGVEDGWVLAIVGGAPTWVATEQVGAFRIAVTTGLEGWGGPSYSPPTYAVANATEP